MSNLVKPIVETSAQEVKFTESELAGYKEASKLDDSEVKTLQTATSDESKIYELKVSVTNVTTQSTLEADSIKIAVKITNNSSTETPGTPQEITKEVLETKYNEYNSLQENDYTS